MTTDLLSRTPPSDVDAERALLGSLFLDPSKIDVIRPMVEPSFFHDEHNRIIYRHLTNIEVQWSAGDWILLRKEMGDQWEQVGGSTTVAKLADCVPHAYHAKYYAEIVRKCAMLRGVVNAGANIMRDAFMPDAGPGMLKQTQDTLADLERSLSSQETVSSDSVLAAVMDEMDRSDVDNPNKAVPTGFDEIDHMLGGLWPEDLVILAARPSQGKTGLAAQIAMNVSRAWAPVLFSSLEMTAGQVMTRLLCGEAGIDTNVVRGGNPAEFHRENLIKAMAAMQGLPIQFNDNPEQSIGTIGSQARAMKQANGLGLVIVDQLSHVEPIDPSDFREQQVAKISQAFKRMARQLHVPVMVLCQINRSQEGKSDNRPTLASLRESGRIEADADVVMAIHRPGFYAKDEKDDTAEVLILKQRHGRTGTVHLNWQKSVVRFTSRTVVDMDNYTDFSAHNDTGSEFT